jgi:hypothetical protein
VYYFFTGLLVGTVAGSLLKTSEYRPNIQDATVNDNSFLYLIKPKIKKIICDAVSYVIRLHYSNTLFLGDSRKKTQICGSYVETDETPT